VTLPCWQPLPIADLVDYALGELDGPAESAVDEHLFACDDCTRALESIVQLGADVGRAVAQGRTAAPVSDALVRRATGRGVRIREYRLAPGETVPCTAAPDDTFVAIRLAGPFADGAGLTIETEFEDLTSGQRETYRAEDVPADVTAGGVVLLFPGDTVRAYPRSRWTMYVSGVDAGPGSRLGPYTLDHTPWPAGGG
jgi:hypothetical protein